MNPRRTIESFRRDTARRLRASATAAETKLWRELRKSPMLGSHFRRQVPLGPYIADFACLASHLIVEVDGSQHGHEFHRGHDAKRTAWLEREGYRVLRFWNSDLSENMQGVLETIHAELFGSRDTDAIALKHQRRVRED